MSTEVNTLGDCDIKCWSTDGCVEFWYLVDAVRTQPDFDITKHPTCLLLTGTGCTTDPTSITWQYDTYKPTVKNNIFVPSGYKDFLKETISIVAAPESKTFIDIEKFMIKSSMDTCGALVGLDFSLNNYCEIKDLYGWFESLSADEEETS